MVADDIEIWKVSFNVFCAASWEMTKFWILGSDKADIAQMTAVKV